MIRINNKIELTVFVPLSYMICCEFLYESKRIIFFCPSRRLNPYETGGVIDSHKQVFDMYNFAYLTTQRLSTL